MEIIIKCSDEMRGSRNIYGEPIKEVVRCKECKHWVGNISEDDGIYEDECKWITEEAPNADDYCSYGVKKGADDE